MLNVNGLRGLGEGIVEEEEPSEWDLWGRDIVKDILGAGVKIGTAAGVKAVGGETPAPAPKPAPQGQAPKSNVPWTMIAVGAGGLLLLFMLSRKKQLAGLGRTKRRNRLAADLAAELEDEDCGCGA